MGCFYVSHAVKIADQQLVKDVLRKLGRNAAVSAPQDGIIIVLDEKCDSQDDREIERLSAILSAETKSVCFAVLNHDDDVMMYWLGDGGRIIDRYNSMPSFDTIDDPPLPPAGGDAVLLAPAFGRQGSEVEIETVLRAPFGDDKYVFALDRHGDLCRWLGLPWPMSGVGFGYYEADDIPGMAAQFTRV